MAEQKVSSPIELARSIDAVAAEHNIVALSNIASQMERTFVLAGGVAKIKSLLTDQVMRDYIVPLAGKSLGFKVDKANYSVAELREVTIEAILYGAFPVGNEFNVLFGASYLTKNFFKRKVEEFPGIGNLKVIPEPPTRTQSGAQVKVHCEWTLEKKSFSEDWTFPCRSNANDSADIVQGKGLKKAYERIYRIISGSKFDLPSEDIDGPGITVTPSGETVDSDGVVIEPQKVQGDGTLFDNQQQPAPAPAPQEKKGPLSDLKAAVRQQQAKK